MSYISFGNQKIKLKILKHLLNINEQCHEMILGIRPEHIHIDVSEEILIVKVPYEVNKNVGDNIRFFIDESKLYLFDKTDHKLVSRLC